MIPSIGETMLTQHWSLPAEIGVCPGWASRAWALASSAPPERDHRFGGAHLRVGKLDFSDQSLQFAFRNDVRFRQLLRPFLAGVGERA
ncbi:MAG: hypothetical protein HoeaKO_18040 [Hoeflea alexandrii]